MNIDEITFHLKSQCSTFIQDIPSQESVPSFEAISHYLKTF